MFSKIQSLWNHIQTKRLYNKVVKALANGYELVNTTRIETYQTRRYEYSEVMIDHVNYQLQDMNGNFIAYVPSNVVDMLPESEYRKVTDSCDLGTFYRVEVVLNDFDNLTASEVYSLLNRYQIASPIVKATLVRDYPSTFAYYGIEPNATLAYDFDCKPTKKQAKEAFNNELLRLAKRDRRSNELYS